MEKLDGADPSSGSNFGVVAEVARGPNLLDAQLPSVSEIDIFVDRLGVSLAERIAREQSFLQLRKRRSTTSLLSGRLGFSSFHSKPSS